MIQDAPVLQETVYTADPQLRRPGLLLRRMAADSLASRELAWRLLVRDISTLYRQTALGYFWAVFPPLVTSAVFILLNSSRVLATDSVGMPYPAYVIMGTVFFGLFTDALNAPLKIVTNSKAMLVRVNFPREALLMAAVGQVMFSFGIKLALLAATLLFFGVLVQPAAPAALVPLLGLLLLGLMLGVLVVPLGLLLQDFAYGLAVLTTGLMFLTPVAYPPPREGALAAITAANPLTPLMMAAREYVTMGHSGYTGSMLWVSLGALILMLVGWVLFRLALPIVVERIGTT